MKKTILFISITFVTFFANAQSEEADALLDKISMETCECVENKGLDYSKISSSKLELEFGICIMESYAKNKRKAEKYLDVSLNDDASLEKFGEDIGFLMVNNCPDVIMALAGNYAADEFEETKDDLTLTGKIINIETTQFNTIEIKDDSNRVQKLLWLEYFEGEEFLSNSKVLKKKNMEVVYIEKELYDPKIKEYRNFKIIKKISVL